MSSLRLALKLSIEDFKTPDQNDSKKVTKAPTSTTKPQKKKKTAECETSKRVKSGEDDISSDSETEVKDSENESIHKMKTDSRKKNSPSFPEQPLEPPTDEVSLTSESSVNSLVASRQTPPLSTPSSIAGREPRKKNDRPKTPLAKTKQDKITSQGSDPDPPILQSSELFSQQNIQETSEMISISCDLIGGEAGLNQSVAECHESPEKIDKMTSQELSLDLKDSIQKAELEFIPEIGTQSSPNLPKTTDVGGEDADDEALEKSHQKDEKTPSTRKGTKRKRRGGLDVSESEANSTAIDHTEKCDDPDEGNENIRGSSRAAAMAAKTKLNNTTTKNRQPIEIETRKAEEILPHTEIIPSISSSILLKAQWVACDRCGKWRSLPGDVDLSTLPEQWYCSMNKWDTLHADCAHEEEEYLEKDQEDEISLRATRNEPSDAPNKRSKVGRGGRLGNRRGRKPNPRESEHTIVNQSPLIQGDNTDDETGDSYMGTRRRRGARANYTQPEIEFVESQAIYSLPPNTTLEKVHWVQCGKCSKWRKVPGKVHEEGLPDVWYCALNTWALEYARCTAKEEEDDTISLAPMTGRLVVDARGVGRGRYVRKTRLNDPTTPSTIRPWVQCERKNCKKWRKVPAHIDLSTLPEKWYCEMNLWDPERATCDASEETDSEGDTQFNAVTRTQLILGNSKGPGTLSYRRLIFGTDGRIRPFYSEKNKNGSGLFSYTEVFRPNDGDEYVMPTRKVSYWWSNVYQDSGSQYTSSSKPDREKKVEVEKIETVKCLNNYQSVLRPNSTQHMIDTITRLASQSFPSHDRSMSKWSKNAQEGKKQTLLSRINYCCEIIRSCLLVSYTDTLTLLEIYRQVLSMYYINREMETCRSSLGLEEIKETLHRLEQLGEIEVIYDNEGNLAFRLVMQIIERKNLTNPFPDLLSSSDPFMEGKSRPLKMRKRKFRLVETSNRDEL